MAMKSKYERHTGINVRKKSANKYQLNVNLEGRSKGHEEGKGSPVKYEE